MKAVGIVRDRGQLTIPDSIRKLVNWVTPLSAVSISVIKPDEIVIRPHGYQREVNWEMLWKQIKRVRAFKGSGRGDLSTFITEDRESRR